jgi:hypothetical protein
VDPSGQGAHKRKYRSDKEEFVPAETVQSFLGSAKQKKKN